mgnify:CR=1 FL=1
MGFGLQTIMIIAGAILVFFLKKHTKIGWGLMVAGLFWPMIQPLVAGVIPGV